MNSSGIKRGLAASAISALAVAGLPLLAGAANAAPGDSIALGSVGPIRTGNSAGGDVVIKISNADLGDANNNGAIDGAEVNQVGRLQLALQSDRSKAPSNGSQTVSLVGTPSIAYSGSVNDSNPTDGLAEVTLHVAVTTPSAGDQAKFTVFYNANDSAAPDATSSAYNVGEPLVDVNVTTAGKPTAVAVSPATQTAPINTASGKYTAAITDAAGRPTQLVSGESFSLAGGPANITFAPASPLGFAAFNNGSATFTAAADATGVQTLRVEGTAGTPVEGVNTTATLDVVSAADIATAGQYDVVTAADNWNGYLPADGTSKALRIDQNSVVVNIKGGAGNANKTASVTASSANVTFGGATSKTYTVALDGSGNGSFTVAVDASSIADTDSFTLNTKTAGGVTKTSTLTYQVTQAAITTSGVTAKYGTTATVTATVTDQFGAVVPGAYVTAQRTAGPNTPEAPTARTATDSSGKVSFQFTDTKASSSVSKVDTVTFNAYNGPGGALIAGPTSTSITWNADGLGSDYVLTIGGTNTTGSTYDPAKTIINPVIDTVATPGTDAFQVDAAGLAANTPMTVSADNGAVIIKNGTAFADGVASVDGKKGDTFYVVGTKTGLVTVTVASGGRSKTAQFTVASASPNTTFARNVDVAAPAKANSGQLATFTAKVTDAFGNPIVGLGVNSLNIQVSGPAALQDTSGITDANGELKLNVRIQDGTSSPVSVAVTGLPSATNQFGAAANRAQFQSSSDDAKGLTASVQSDAASVTPTNIQALEQAVADAQAKVDAAQTVVDNFTAKVAADNAKVAKAKQQLKKAKKRHMGVKKAERRLAKLKLQRTQDRRALAVAKANLATAQAELAQAQADLDAANS